MPTVPIYTALVRPWSHFRGTSLRLPPLYVQAVPIIAARIPGEIEVSKLTINSADYADAKGFHFIQDSLQTINQEKNTVKLGGGDIEHFELLSVNVGGTQKKISTEFPFNTIYLRPLDDFMARWREVQRIFSACVSPQFVVVGGGAATVEVATALQAYQRRKTGF